MFPRELDHAQVLWYTDKGDYGCIYYTTGDICDQRSFYAICQYPAVQGFYLFSCDAHYEVIFDDLLDSVEDCKQQVAQRYPNVIWHTAEQTPPQ